LVSDKLVYYPTVTREPFRNTGRITDLITSNRLFDDIGLRPMSTQDDRVMLCGSPSMLRDVVTILRSRDFREGSHSEPGHFVVERAFVEK
jgi:ferredoxin--NADP+ reductase